MNKKIFATALLAIATFVSTGVSAAVTFADSTDLSVAQGADSIVGQGATARANDIKITLSQTNADKELPKDGEIVVRLPEGLNFSGQPSFLVVRGASGNLSLKDSSSFGDATPGEAYGVTPTVGVTLFDTNGDGGMDRAVAVAASNGGATDTVTISMDVTADAKATVSASPKQAVVSVNGTSGKVDLIVVQAADISKGVTSSATTKLITAQQALSGNTDIGTTTPTVYITIPKGTKNNATVTLAPTGNVAWGQTSTITLTTITPFNSSSNVASPLTGTLVISSVTNGTGAIGLTQSITLTVANAGSAGLPNDTTVKLSIDKLTLTGTTTATTGEQGLKVAGTAKITGVAKFFNVTKNGSSAALAKGAKVISLVKGSTAYQTLPSITLTELFEGDITGGTGSDTITISAGTGLSFEPLTAGISITGATLGAPSATITATKLVLTLATNTGNTLSMTISGIKAKGTGTGDLSVKVGGKTIDSQYGPAGDDIVVAKGLEVGKVNVTGPKKLTKVGPAKVTTGTDAKVVLAETTYGSITKASIGASEVAYISVTPSSGKLTGANIAVTSAWTGAPTFLDSGVCAIESKDSKTYICKINAESTALPLPGTNTVTITAKVSGEGAVVGDTIALEIGGNVGVSGTVDVATVLESSSVKVTGGTTQVKEGSTEIQKVSGFVISQVFDNSLSDGEFRILAPQGVAFVSGLEPSSKAGGTASDTVTTFYPNDTLVMSSNALGATGTITVSSPSVLIAPSVTGDIVFSLIDGNVSGKAKIGLVAESLTLAYADKSLKALSGGKDISLKVDYDTTQEIVGGLVGDGYTVKSSSTPTVTVSLSGSTMTIKGVAAGAANITVTDSLGQTDVVAVTVSAGATIPAAAKAAKGAGDRTGVTFGAGASKDGGATYGTEFSVDDEVTIIATVGVDATDVGEAGAIHVAGKLAGGSFVYLDEDGLFAEWDLSGLPGATIVTEELKASYTVTVVNASKLPAGEHRFALAYSTGGEVIYTGKALVITIAE